MDFDAEFVERGYMKKLEKLRAESIAKEIGTIELLVLEIWLSQFFAHKHAPILCLFVF